MARPVRDQVYSFIEINGLSVEDSPFLMIHIRGESVPVQNTEDPAILDLPWVADRKWKFSRTTGEGIPLFYFTGTVEEAKSFLDTEDEDGQCVIYPKGVAR